MIALPGPPEFAVYAGRTSSRSIVFAARSIDSAIGDKILYSNLERHCQHGSGTGIEAQKACRNVWKPAAPLAPLPADSDVNEVETDQTRQTEDRRAGLPCYHFRLPPGSKNPSCSECLSVSKRRSAPKREQPEPKAANRIPVPATLPRAFSSRCRSVCPGIP